MVQISLAYNVRSIENEEQSQYEFSKEKNLSACPFAHEETTTMHVTGSTRTECCSIFHTDNASRDGGNRDRHDGCRYSEYHCYGEHIDDMQNLHEMLTRKQESRSSCGSSLGKTNMIYKELNVNNKQASSGKEKDSSRRVKDGQLNKC